MKRAAHRISPRPRTRARIAFTPSRWFFPLLAVALVACNNSGSLNSSVMGPATRTPTDTPGVGSTDTPVPAATMSPTAVKTTTPQGSATPTPTPTATPAMANGLPDLVPLRIDVVAPTPESGCIHDIDEVMVSVEVCVLNQGDAAAGPFDAELRVAGAVVISFPGADAGTEVCESSPVLSGPMEFAVDPGDQVVESDEANNQEIFVVERPTLPPTCPTPTS